MSTSTPEDNSQAQYWLKKQGVKNENNSYNLSIAQAQAILHSLHIEGHVTVTRIREYNHTYRIQRDNDTFFLKTFTKDWYTLPNSGTYCVQHEQAAWSILASHNIATPDVLLAALDDSNPFGQPFILTKGLQGEPLDTLLKRANEQELHTLLHTLGIYMQQMHAITFRYPGYLMSAGGPTQAPDEHAWQHGIWTATQRQKDALAWVQDMRPTLSNALAQRLEQRFSTLAQELASDYIPPRFVHGDCHLEQFFLQQERGQWRINGVVDMEVASAGASIVDVVTVCRELAQMLPAHTHWWESFFAAYEGVPNFEHFKLQMLVFWYPYEAHIWPGTGDNGFNHILTATNWEELFSGIHLPTKNS